MDKEYDYKYDCEPDPYVYPGTTVLKNNFDIRDQKLLSTLERQITGVKVLQQNRLDITEGNFDLEHLKAVHKFLFADIYDWAGEIRTCGFISKGASIFCFAPLIESYADSIFSKMHLENFSQMNRAECAQRMAYYISEVNALHPFREGNGRAMRLFFEALAFRHGWQLSLSTIPHDALVNAVIKSMNNALTPLSQLLANHLVRFNDDAD